MNPDDNPYRASQVSPRPDFEVTVERAASPHYRPTWRVFATVCMCIVGMLYGARALRILKDTVGWQERLALVAILSVFALVSFLGARGWYQGWLKSACIYSAIGTLPLWGSMLMTIFAPS